MAYWQKNKCTGHIRPRHIPERVGFKTLAGTTSIRCTLNLQIFMAMKSVSMILFCPMLNVWHRLGLNAPTCVNY